MIPSSGPTPGHILPPMAPFTDRDGYLPVRVAAALAHLPSVTVSTLLGHLEDVEKSRAASSGR